jgi:hypothetical protein
MAQSGRVHFQSKAMLSAEDLNTAVRTLFLPLPLSAPSTLS